MNFEAETLSDPKIMFLSEKKCHTINIYWAGTQQEDVLSTGDFSKDNIKYSEFKKSVISYLKIRNYKGNIRFKKIIIENTTI